MRVTGLDHIVLCVNDVEASVAFYRDLLGMDPREERPGKWSLRFGDNKISLQDVRNAPDLARDTVPGSGNFCLLTDEPVDAVADAMAASGVHIESGPALRAGATGTIRSIYFRDPDGNLIELSNRVE
jgi:catechol 2,3-dioxygenase-like lactoylglutathione lyase family enzyme